MFRIKNCFLFTAFLLLSGMLQAQSTDSFDLDQVYRIDPNGTISLDSDDAEVTIAGSDREDVRVFVRYRMEVEGFSFGEDEEFEMIVEEQGSDLRIYEKERDFGRVSFGSVREEYEIRIEAPRGVSLDLEGDDETYQISGIDGAINLDADDTTIELRDCNGDTFNFTMDDGDLRLDGGNGRLHMDLDDGRANIQNGNFNEIMVDSDDAEIAITTRLFDGGSYRFDFDDGDLRLNVAGGGGEFEVSHDNADISASRQFEQIVDEENESVFRLSGGNARVIVDTDDGDIEFRVI